MIHNKSLFHYTASGLSSDLRPSIAALTLVCVCLERGVDFWRITEALLSTLVILHGRSGIMTETTENAITIHDLFGVLITQCIKKDISWQAGELTGGEAASVEMNDTRPRLILHINTPTWEWKRDRGENSKSMAWCQWFDVRQHVLIEFSRVMGWNHCFESQGLL